MFLLYAPLQIFCCIHKAGIAVRKAIKTRTWILKHSTVSALWCRTAPRVPNTTYSWKYKGLRVGPPLFAQFSQNPGLCLLPSITFHSIVCTRRASDTSYRSETSFAKYLDKLNMVVKVPSLSIVTYLSHWNHTYIPIIEWQCTTTSHQAKLVLLNSIPSHGFRLEVFDSLQKCTVR